MTDETRQSPAETVSHDRQTVDVCSNCRKPEPTGGWYMVGGPAPLEFFCSAQCLDEDLHGVPDDDDQLEETCGRWVNGRLGRGCSLAGTEFCDWSCPYAR